MPFFFFYKLSILNSYPHGSFADNRSDSSQFSQSQATEDVLLKY